jgi:hypothetical protein
MSFYKPHAVAQAVVEKELTQRRSGAEEEKVLLYVGIYKVISYKIRAYQIFCVNEPKYI